VGSGNRCRARGESRSTQASPPPSTSTKGESRRTTSPTVWSLMSVGRLDQGLLVSLFWPSTAQEWPYPWLDECEEASLCVI
jgi:hypothetical protein